MRQTPKTLHTYERTQDEENVEVVVRESEERDANVAKDEVFREKVQQLEELLRPVLGARRQVVERVVSLTNAAKQHSHYPREIRRLRHQEGRVGHEDEERGLEHGEVREAGELGENGREASHDGAEQEGEAKLAREGEEGREDRLEVAEALPVVLVLAHALREDDGDGVA